MNQVTSPAGDREATLSNNGGHARRSYTAPLLGAVVAIKSYPGDPTVTGPPLDTTSSSPKHPKSTMGTILPPRRLYQHPRSYGASLRDGPWATSKNVGCRGRPLGRKRSPPTVPHHIWGTRRGSLSGDTQHNRLKRSSLEAPVIHLLRFADGVFSHTLIRTILSFSSHPSAPASSRRVTSGTHFPKDAFKVPSGTFPLHQSHPCAAPACTPGYSIPPPHPGVSRPPRVRRWPSHKNRPFRQSLPSLPRNHSTRPWSHPPDGSLEAVGWCHPRLPR